MYDTARRVELVKRRVREMSRRRQRRGIYGLSALCALLFAALAKTADMAIGRGQTAAAAVVLTIVCVRLHEREKKKTESKEENAP